MEFHAAIENAEKVIQSGSGAAVLDVRGCREAVNMLDTAQGNVAAAGLGEDSPVVTAAEELRQSLQVCVLRLCSVLYLVQIFST